MKTLKQQEIDYGDRAARRIRRVRPDDGSIAASAVSGFCLAVALAKAAEEARHAWAGFIFAEACEAKQQLALTKVRFARLAQEIRARQKEAVDAR